MKTVLAGGVTKGIDLIDKAESVSVLVELQPKLVVVENGDTRSLHISRAVAEVLIANGMNYGS